jgi:outer membrane protein
VLAAAMLPTLARADVLGWRIGANAWAQAYEGDIANGPSKIDVEDDLGYDDDDGLSFYAAFEHPVPVLPNIMVTHTELESDATGSVTGFIFDGIVYSGDVASSVDLTHTDLTLYYEILDNWVNLDLGLAGRYFDNGVQITDVATGITGSLDIDYVIPMVYAQLRFDLPLSGLSVGVEGNAISYDDDSLYDAKVNIAYRFAFGLGIEGGYRVMDFDYEDDDDEFADVTIDGVYGGLYWDF